MVNKSRLFNCHGLPEPVNALAGDRRRSLVLIFKALGDDTRLEVFRLIAGQSEPVCVCDIVAQFDVSQPTISHHLRVLREAGLITVSRNGNWSFFSVDADANSQLRAVFALLALEPVGLVVG